MFSCLVQNADLRIQFIMPYQYHWFENFPTFYSMDHPWRCKMKNKIPLKTFLSCMLYNNLMKRKRKPSEDEMHWQQRVANILAFLKHDKDTISSRTPSWKLNHSYSNLNIFSPSIAGFRENKIEDSNYQKEVSN